MSDNGGHANRWKALAFIGVSLLVISLDNTILNVALPSISRDLGASASDLQWMVDAYVLVFASLLLTMGSISDRVGRKRALQFGLVMFGIGSVAAALSTSTGMLIASRAFLGIGGATIMPATLSIVSATFPPEERAQAIAIWAGIFGLGIGIGPLTGGLLLEWFDWNAVFYVNLPVVAVALAGGYLYITESKDETAPKPDFVGVLFSITGLFALVYGIIKAGETSWTDQEVLLSLGGAVILLGIFAWWENRADEPMLPLHFFKNMWFTGANLAMVLVMFAMFGSVFFLSQYFQSVQGYTALEVGVRMLPMAVTLMIVASSSARVAARLGTKVVVALGIFIVACGMLYLSQVSDVNTPYGSILIGLVVFASGMGLTMSPATNSIMQSIPVNKAGIGSAMNDTTRQLGGALGVAILGTVMNDIYLDGVAELEALLPSAVYEGISSSIQGAKIVAANIGNIPQAPAGAAERILDMANNAFVDGMTGAMVVAAAIMFAASLLAFIILPAQVQGPDGKV